MTKYEFMRELENLLHDISMDERMEALQYYENYFEDAGTDREQNIISELGSPDKVAAIIKAEYYNDQADCTRGYFTERGYKDTSYSEPKYEIIDGIAVERDLEESNDLVIKNQKAPLNEYNYNHQNNSDKMDDIKTKADSQYRTRTNEHFNSNTNTNTNTNTNNNTDTNFNSTDSKFNDSYGRSYQYNSTERETDRSRHSNGASKIILITLLCIFALPIGLPLVISIFAVFFGLVVSVFALWISFAIVGVVLTFVGIGLSVLGIVKLVAIPVLGIAYAGTGLILFGVGLLFTTATVGLSIKVIPGLFRGFINLCRVPFRRRSVIA